jgi:hypothetical protein
MYAINASTGQEIWALKGQYKELTLAGGYIVAPNECDGQIYTIGKGPSAITVAVPSLGVTTATPLTITGTIIDKSAGSQQENVVANFPNGLPCVSDASQTQFMEAVYEQQPMPSNITGVPVTISVLDSNGNSRNIGTTTSNDLGTYALTWTPDIAGNYTVTATFGGTGAYYGSSASTAFYASEASPTTTPTTAVANYATPLDLMEYIVGATIAIIIAIAIVGVLSLRKKP